MVRGQAKHLASSAWKGARTTKFWRPVLSDIFSFDVRFPFDQSGHRCQQFKTAATGDGRRYQRMAMITPNSSRYPRVIQSEETTGLLRSRDNFYLQEQWGQLNDIFTAAAVSLKQHKSIPVQVSRMFVIVHFIICDSQLCLMSHLFVGSVPSTEPEDPPTDFAVGLAIIGSFSTGSSAIIKWTSDWIVSGSTVVSLSGGLSRWNGKI